MPKDYTAEISCIGAWLCDENAGETLTDKSQNLNNFTFKAAGEPAWSSVNPPKSYTPCYIDFDGINDICTLINPALLNAALDSGYSFCAWIKFGDLARDRAAIGGAGNFELTLQCYLDGELYCYFGHGTSWVQSGQGKINDINTWYHIAATRKTTGQKKVYINGVDQLGADHGGQFAIAPPQLYLGLDAGAGYLKGKMCQVAIFNTELLQADIDDIITYGLKPQAVYPKANLKRGFNSGFAAFLSQYCKAKKLGLTPLKLPDGTPF